MPTSEDKRLWNVVLSTGVVHERVTTTEAKAMLLARQTGDPAHDSQIDYCVHRLDSKGIAEIWSGGHRIINVH